MHMHVGYFVCCTYLKLHGSDLYQSVFFTVQQACTYPAQLETFLSWSGKWQSLDSIRRTNITLCCGWVLVMTKVMIITHHHHLV